MKLYEIKHFLSLNDGKTISLLHQCLATNEGAALNKAWKCIPKKYQGKVVHHEAEELKEM